MLPSHTPSASSIHVVAVTCLPLLDVSLLLKASSPFFQELMAIFPQGRYNRVARLGVELQQNCLACGAASLPLWYQYIWDFELSFLLSPH